jgi:hypothetical protein
MACDRVLKIYEKTELSLGVWLRTANVLEDGVKPWHVITNVQKDKYYKDQWYWKDDSRPIKGSNTRMLKPRSASPTVGPLHIYTSSEIPCIDNDNQAISFGSAKRYRLT